MHTILNIALIVLFGLLCSIIWLHYHPRTSLVTNLFHMVTKTLSNLDGPLHYVHENDTKTIEKMRKGYTYLTRRERREPTVMQNLSVPSISGSHSIPVFLYKPMREVGNANHQQNYPLVVYFHGGGFVMGDAQMYEHVTSVIANEAQVAVATVEYRLAPEHKFPAAHEDCIDATRWFLDATNTAALGLDSTRVGVAGDSAGGNIAAVVGAELPTSLKVLASVYPGSIVSDFITKSYLENAHAPVLSVDDKNWFHAMYFGPRRDLGHHPLYSPLSREPPTAVAPEADDGNPTSTAANRKVVYPITHVITAELDILRDDGEIYVDFLREAGVNVSHVRYNNTPHGFFGLNMFPHGQEALYSVCSLIKENL